MTCGFCKNGAVCDKVSGNCTRGCDRGHRGHQCKSGCDKQTFGNDCMNVCHCYECNDVDGSCGIYSCYSDWKGESCSESIHTNEKQAESSKTDAGNTAFAVVSTLLVVSVIGHIVVVTIYCRRKARK
ncbi:TIE2-like protein, partial [Mya arenaria]